MSSTTKKPAKKAASKRTSKPNTPTRPAGNPLILPRRRVVVKLSAGADAERLEEIDDELNRLLSMESRKPAEKMKVRQLVEERNSLCEAGQAAQIRVVLEEPHFRGFVDSDGADIVGYADLQADHPPRNGHGADARAGFNTDTFAPALVRLCMVEPVVTDDEWAEFIPGGGPTSVSAFNWSKLTDAAADLTHREPVLPKPLPVSALLPTNDGE